MEKRINKKIEHYISNFKDNIREKYIQLGLNNSDNINNGSHNQLLQYIYDYERLTLGPEDFTKRKRVKNVVPGLDRCCAKRATNQQCTRRKKEGCEYCGTHMKGTPHGVVDFDQEISQVTTQKIDVWAQDIQGIIYYIDNNKNIYKAEDIIIKKSNPSIIGKYALNGEKYSIAQFSEDF